MAMKATNDICGLFTSQISSERSRYIDKRFHCSWTQEITLVDTERNLKSQILGRQLARDIIGPQKSN